MKSKKYIYLFIIGLLFFYSCQLDEIEDPNNPSITLVTKNATKGQLQTLITGLEASSRGYLSTTANALGTFGRDIWYFNYNDGRNVQYWTGQVGGQPDANFYGVGSIYTSPYQAIKQANILINAVQNTDAVNAQEQLVYLGFAKTIQGYQYLVPANTQYKNGIRIDVSDESNPGPFVGYEEALKAIKELLDEGYKNLIEAGVSSLPFTLTNGYASFSSVAGLAKVNRALAARLALYREDWEEALEALELSFFDLEGNLNTGPAHVYGAPPESYNPFYYVLGADLRTLPVVHPLFVEEAIPGDKRITDKIYVREKEIINTVGTVPLASKYQDKRWVTNTTPIPYIRNEELVLIYAEASIHLKAWSNAVKAINVIRNAAEIGNYTGLENEAALIDEILLQRRYSLWFEPGGHRWIDLRRYNKLEEISTELDGGTVFIQLARPTSEVNWDNYVNEKK
jgi:hypothetical protein